MTERGATRHGLPPLAPIGTSVGDPAPGAGGAPGTGGAPSAHGSTPGDVPTHTPPTSPSTSTPTGTPPVGTPRAGRRRRWITIAAVAALVLLAAGIVVNRRTSDGGDALDKKTVDTLVDDKVAKALKDLKAEPATSAVVYNTILPSLVLIRSERPSTATKEGSGLGSGVIINADGSILTSLHVVDGATSLRVTFADGTESAATISSSDPTHDSAVLTAATPPQVIVPAVMGSAGRVGDEAFAVGHPLGLRDSLTAGVISGFGRSIPLEKGGALTGLIQFDAAVNPGNSGGPLLNRNGEVIGIVTALADPSDDGYFIGIGFAVPITVAGGAAGAPPQ